MAVNDFLEITKKILSPPIDIRAQVPKDSTSNKRYYLSDYAVKRSETYSFIVDWELPKNKNVFENEGKI